MNDPFLPSNIALKSRLRCAHCRWEGRALALAPIQNPIVRLRPGDEIPAGDCPKCGELVYLGTGHLTATKFKSQRLGNALDVYAESPLGDTETLVARVSELSSPTPMVQFKTPIGAHNARQTLRYVQTQLHLEDVPVAVRGSKS